MLCRRRASRHREEQPAAHLKGFASRAPARETRNCFGPTVGTLGSCNIDLELVRSLVSLCPRTTWSSRKPRASVLLMPVSTFTVSA